MTFTYESPTKPKDQTIEKMESNEIDCETREGNAFTKCIFVREFGWNPAWPGVLHSKNDTHLTLFVTVVEDDGGNIYVSHAFQRGGSKVKTLTLKSGLNITSNLTLITV